MLLRACFIHSSFTLQFGQHPLYHTPSSPGCFAWQMADAGIVTFLRQFRPKKEEGKDTINTK